MGGDTRIILALGCGYTKDSPQVPGSYYHLENGSDGVAPLGFQEGPAAVWLAGQSLLTITSHIKFAPTQDLTPSLHLKGPARFFPRNSHRNSGQITL